MINVPRLATLGGTKARASASTDTELGSQPSGNPASSLVTHAAVVHKSAAPPPVAMSLVKTVGLLSLLSAVSRLSSRRDAQH